MGEMPDNGVEKESLSQAKYKGAAIWDHLVIRANKFPAGFNQFGFGFWSLATERIRIETTVNTT